MAIHKLLLILLTTLALLIVPVTAFQAQLLETRPAPTQAGEFADITIRVDTQGLSTQELGEFTLRIRETDFIRPVPGHERTFRALSPGQTITHTVRVYLSSSIPTGEIPLEVLLESSRSSRDFSLPLYVSGAQNKPELHIGSIRSTPDKLLQDTKSNTIEITLQNLGDKEAQLVTANLVADESLITEAFSFSMQDSTASIAPGAQAVLRFDIDIEETDLLRIPAELELRYRTRNDFDNSFMTVQESLSFDLRLTSAPRYEILEMEPVNGIQAGTSNNQLRVSIQNVGLEEARSVRIRLYPDPASPFDFERTSIFISSNIRPGEEATVLIPFDVLNDALIQDYFVNAEFESLVGAARYTQEARLTIPVTQEASDGLSSYLFIIIVLSLVVAGVIGFLYNRKKN